MSVAARSAAAVALAAVAAAMLARAAGPVGARPYPVVRTALPLVVIETSGPVRADPKVTARLRLVRNGRGRLNLSSQRGTDYDGPVGIELRGHSSGQFPKRSYSFETRDAAGDARDVSLAGLPRENDWILYASYNDKTLLRNALALWTSRTLGRYAPRTAFVELVLNGRYQGVYVLVEKVKRDRNRVRLDERDVTGGYLLEGTVDKQLRGGQDFFRGVVTGKPFRYHDPKRKRLSAVRAAWIRDHVNRFERALYAASFRDAGAGYRPYLDLGSAVDYVLLNELFKNQDAFQTSLFVAKGAGEGLRLGPVWDFDVSMGNSNYLPSGQLEGWLLQWRPWASRLYRDPAFVSAVAERWRGLREQGLVPRLLRWVDVQAALLEPAQRRNFRRWPVLGQYVWPNPVDPATGRPRATYAAEVTYLKSWLVRRAAWLDANLPLLQARAERQAGVAPPPPPS